MRWKSYLFSRFHRVTAGPCHLLRCPFETSKHFAALHPPGAAGRRAMWPTRRMTQQQAVTLCPKTAPHPRPSAAREVTRMPVIQAAPGVCATHPPPPQAHSCVALLLRLHIACDLTASQQLCGKEGWGSLCVWCSAALKTHLGGGGQGRVQRSRSNERNGSGESWCGWRLRVSRWVRDARTPWQEIHQSGHRRRPPPTTQFQKLAAFTSLASIVYLQYIDKIYLLYLQYSCFVCRR